MSRSKATRAQVVSAALGRGGLRPLASGTSRMREGLRVTHTHDNGARVHADLDSERDAAMLSEEAERVLLAAGFPVERVDPCTVVVARARGSV